MSILLVMFLLCLHYTKRHTGYWCSNSSVCSSIKCCNLYRPKSFPAAPLFSVLICDIEQIADRKIDCQSHNCT